MVADCLFCRIVSGEIPSTKVAETSRVLAFNDIEPSAPTHVLLIPKAHLADSVEDFGPEDAGWIAELMQLAAQIAKDAGLERGWRLITNVGSAAGQTVFHVHFHLMGGWPDS